MNKESFRWLMLLFACNIFWIFIAFQSRVVGPVHYESCVERISSKSLSSRDREVLTRYRLDPNQLDERGTKVLKFRKWLDEYTELHKKVIAERRAGRDKDNKYLLCQPINGMGNMLQVLIPCILYAMVTNRTVLIDNANNHFIPAEHWPFQTPSHGADIIFQRSLFEEFCTADNAQKCEGAPLIRADASRIMCDDLIESHKSHRMIIVYGSLEYDTFVGYLMVNPVHRLWEYLPWNWFQMVWDEYLELKPHLRKQVDDFKKEHFGTYNVALQMRVPVSTPGLGYGTDHWFAPALPKKELFYQAAEQMSRTAPAPYENITWFLATQDNELIKWFKDNRKGKVAALTLEKPVVSFDVSDIKGKEAGVVTWYLIMESNDAVVTDFSSYGHTAAAAGGIVPVACNHKHFCVRRLTAEPCQQSPALHPMTCLLDEPIQFLGSDLSCSFVAANRN